MCVGTFNTSLDYSLKLWYFRKFAIDFQNPSPPTVIILFQPNLYSGSLWQSTQTLLIEILRLDIYFKKYNEKYSLLKFKMLKNNKNGR